MAKFGIGVGEEFPVDEPPQRKPEESEESFSERRRYWRRHHVLHLITRIAVIALILSFIVWMFVPHPEHFAAVEGARGFYPHHHHHFFFFPLLLILFLAFAWRRGGCHYHRHWHEHPRGRGPEEA